MAHYSAKNPLPQSSEFFAGIMFLDVSGFTRITEFASSRGHYGVELITDVLNRYFDRLNSLIAPLGGEIVKYGGDACLILFPCSSDKELPDLLSLRDRILELCERLDHYYQRHFGINFAVHGALGAGMVNLVIVGERRHHLDYYLHSDAISDVYHLAESAKSGQILAPPPILEHACHPGVKSGSPAKNARCASAFLPETVRLKLEREDSPAELRNVAVIFIRLSPAKGELIEPEEYNRFYCLIQNLVYAHQGVINKIDYNEKGYLILALFGAPFVSGTDTERAFTTAHHIADLRSDSIKVQTGVTYSNIYCGIIGSSTRWEYGIVGNAVNVAARLMSFAQPGEICLSQEIVPRLEGMFELQFIAKAHVKGIAEPIEIHKLVKEKPHRWAQFQFLFRSARQILYQEELHQLQQTLQQPEALLATLLGAPGTGKSYLLWLLSQSLGKINIPFHFISGNPFNRNQRLEVFFNAMRIKLGVTHFKEQFPLIVAWAQEHGASFDSNLLYHNLFTPTAAQGSEAKQESELVLAILFNLLELVFTADKVLIIDSLENFDSESRQLILRLIRKLMFDKGKVILSGCDLPQIEPEGRVQRIGLTLKPFTTQQSQSFIHEYIPNITRKAASILHEISEGNPRFLSELVRHIVSHFSAGKDLITDQIISEMQHQGVLPDSLENLLMADYEALDADTKSLLKYASIYGRAFNPEELAEIFGISKSPWMQRCLENLHQLGFLQVVQLEPVRLYDIVNPLLTQSVYRSVLLSEKLQLHLSIARHFEQRFSEGDLNQADLIAHHYIQAQDKTKINHWCALLAEQYRNAGALELSLRYYQILSQNAGRKDSLEEAILSGAEIMLQLADNENVKQVLDEYKYLLDLRGYHYDRYLRIWARYLVNTAAYPELRQLLAERLESVGTEDLRWLLEIDLLEAMAYSNEIQTFKKRSLEVYEQLKEKGLISYQNILSSVMALFYSNQGDYRTATGFYRNKLELSRKLKDPIGTRIALSGLGNCYGRRGNKARAIKYYQAALQTAEQSGDRNGYSKVLLNLGVIHRNNQEYDEALECYQKSLIIANFIGNKQQTSIILYDIGELYYYKDDREQALNYISQSLQLAKEMNDVSGMSFCYDALGDLAYRSGRLEEAKQTYRDNLRLQHRINDCEGMAHSIGNLANCAKDEKNYANARKLYELQIKIATEIQDIDDCGRARFNLAMLDKLEKDPKAARENLFLALDLFQRCGAQYYIDITNQQLAELNSPDPPPQA